MMQLDGRRMERKEFTLEYWIDDNWYVGRLKEVLGVFSQGKTLQKLEENIQDAYKMMLRMTSASVRTELVKRTKRISVKV